MEFGPHSSFVIKSPVSCAKSYSPISPQKGGDGYTRETDRERRISHHQNSNKKAVSKSILKNPSAVVSSETDKSSGNADSANAARTGLTRKDLLKTVAFGLTTRLEDTVLAKEGKIGSQVHNRSGKTIIFSHESQSLHKLIVSQQGDIAELKKMVNELKDANARHRSEALEHINIIADLSARLMVVEKQQLNPCASQTGAVGQTSAEENLESSEEGKENVQQRKWEDNRARRDENCGQTQEGEEQVQRKTAKVSASGGALVQRNEILHRLEETMQQNPLFEKRVQSMLRIWGEDCSSPSAALINQNYEESCGQSMLVRVTTQRQELFYSTSPGRNNKRAPVIQTHPKNAYRKQNRPIVTELSDEDDEQLKTIPNVRPSEHCTDDAEFFQNNLDEGPADHVGNHHFVNRRHRREATSAIRNKYK